MSKHDVVFAPWALGVNFGSNCTSPFTTAFYCDAAEHLSQKYNNCSVIVELKVLWGA